MAPDLRRFLWRYPEWWTLGVSSLAWLAILTQALSGGNPHAHHTYIAMSPFAGMTHWMLMVVAMMFPLVANAVRRTAVRSLWTRRNRAMAGFLLGYFALWTLFGLAAAIPRSRLTRGVAPDLLVACGLLATAAWHLTSWRLKAARLCHRTIPLAPRGWPADRDCIRYGWIIGTSCLTTCWILMLVCSVAGHSIPVMAAAGSIAAWERLAAKVRPRVMAAATAAFALAYAIVV